MDDLIKKLALLVLAYAQANRLARVVVVRNVDWKQGVNLGAKQNQSFAFIPHATLLAALRAKCQRSGIEFIETEESYASKKDHRASEPMGPKPEAYRQLESRCTYGSFRSSMGIVLHSDVTAASGSVEK